VLRRNTGREKIEQDENSQESDEIDYFEEDPVQSGASWEMRPLFMAGFAIERIGNWLHSFARVASAVVTGFMESGEFPCG